MKVSFISLAVLLSAGLAAAAPSGDPSKGENCNACAKCEYKNDDCGNQYGGSVICLFSSSLLPTSLTNNYLVTVVTTLAPATSTIPIRSQSVRRGRAASRLRLRRPSRRLSLSRPSRRPSLSRPSRRPSLSRPSRRLSLSLLSRLLQRSQASQRLLLRRTSLNSHVAMAWQRCAATVSVSRLSISSPSTLVLTASQSTVSDAMNLKWLSRSKLSSIVLSVIPISQQCSQQVACCQSGSQVSLHFLFINNSWDWLDVP